MKVIKKGELNYDSVALRIEEALNKFEVDEIDYQKLNSLTRACDVQGKMLVAKFNAKRLKIDIAI